MIILFFELLHLTPSSLQHNKVASDCWKIDHALLPPSPRAAFFHGLQVHHQIVVWEDLRNINKEPLQWRWKIENSNYTLIMIDIETRPLELLRTVCLGGKGLCDANCGCRKAPTIKPQSDQNDYQRSFLDALLNL